MFHLPLLKYLDYRIDWIEGRGFVSLMVCLATALPIAVASFHLYESFFPELKDRIAPIHAEEAGDSPLQR